MVAQLFVKGGQLPMKTRPGSIRPEGVREVKLSSYVTTIVVIHEAESNIMAHRDSKVMCDIIKEHLIGERSEPTDIGPVRNVSVFSVREKQ